MARVERPTEEPGSILHTDAVLPLLSAATAGDERAKHTLVEEAMAYVYPVILSLLHDRRASGAYLSDTMQSAGGTVGHAIEEDGWDLTHATCLKMLAKLHTFRGRDLLGRPVKFTTWLYAIAQNEVRAALRKRWRERRRRRSLEAPENGETMQPEIHLEDHQTPSPEETVVEEAEIEVLRAALQEAPLTPEQRDAVIMFYILGYKQERIARITGVQVGTVKKRVFDGVRKLRTYVETVDATTRDAGGM